MTETADRRSHIRELIARNEVRTQEQLLALLAAEGVETTQATLSRDLREVGVRKQRGLYRLSPAATASAARRRQIAASLRDEVERVERGGTLVVVHTVPGSAQPVARTLGEGELHEIIGTIAGVDTVFVACRTAGHARSLLGLLDRE